MNYFKIDLEAMLTVLMCVVSIISIATYLN